VRREITDAIRTSGVRSAADVAGEFPYRRGIHASMLGQVTVTPEPAFRVADANADGSVDVADLGILATNFNTDPARRARPGGDSNADGAVNVSDLGILATHFGQPAGTPAGAFDQAAAVYPVLFGAAAGVPEPATSGLLVFRALALVARGRRRR
jgi:hypothetical protein